MPDSDRRDLTETYHNFASHLQPGSTISSRYKIVRLLGIGGMGRVYLARDQDLNIDVALKLIRPELLHDELAIDRFKNELILARKVSHKNVARIHDLGEIDGLKFLTMSYIAGKTLRDLIKESGPLPVDQAVLIAEQIADGIQAAHEEGVIHRDLKPANILIDETGRAFVTDFGIARSLDAADHTAAGILLGTPAYLSPEQTWGEKADTRADIYALGLILYEMLTGQLPFDQTTSHAFRTKLPADMDSKIRKLNPEIPSYLIAVLRKSLHPNRQMRYQSLSAFLNDLKTQQIQTPFRITRAAWVTIVAALLITGAFLFRDRWLPPQTELTGERSADVPSVLVLPFINKTNAPHLQWTETGMADMLISDLSQDSQIRVISAERLHQTLDDLKMSGSDFSEQEIQRLAEVLDADWILQGMLMKAGSGVRADLKILDRNEINNPVYRKAAGEGTEDILKISSALAQQVQKQLKLPVDRAESSETVSTSALQSFHQGLAALRESKFEAAAGLFQQSIRQDPNFARAYLKLSETFDATGDYDRALQTLQSGLKVARGPRTRRFLLAQQAMMQGELEKAIGVYRELSRDYPHDSEVLFQLAIACEEAGDLKNAIAALASLVKIDPNHPQAYFHLGKDTILIGEAEEAINRHLVKAVSIYKQLNNRYGEADALNAMGVGYERLGRYDEAIKHYEDSIRIKDEIGNERGTATSLSNIAKIYIFQGEHEKARDYTGRAQRIFEKLSDQRGIAASINQFGVISEDRGDYADALNHYKRALQIRKELGNDQLTAQSYDNVGHIYYLQDRYDDAQVYWEQALSLRRKIGEESGTILSLQNLGFLQTAQGELDKALNSFMEALQQSRAIQYENAIAVSLGNLGLIHQMQGRYQAALDSYKEAVQVLEKLKDKKGIAEYSKMAGSAYLDLTLPGEALEQLKTAATNAEEAQSTEIIADSQVLLARALRMQGELDKAEEALHRAVEIASQREFMKTRARITVEQGWLNLTSKKNAMGPVEQFINHPDPWIRLMAMEVVAHSQLKKRPHATVKTCSDAIGIARKLRSLPFLYKFHSIASQAERAAGNSMKAKQHLDESASFLKQIKAHSPKITQHL